MKTMSALIKPLGKLSLILAALMSISGSAFADDTDANIMQLMKLNPGATKTEILTQAKLLASTFNLSISEVLSKQLLEAQSSATSASNTINTGDLDTNVYRSSGNKEVKLVNADRRGDIFYSPASTLFIEHGHSGIYSATDVIVEAPGIGKTSRHINARSLTVSSGTQIQYVTVSQERRNAAATYAYLKMRDKPYNALFSDNKYVPAVRYNCSQLVWGAYKATSNVDLDSNGGFGVYPADIRDSSVTVTYRTL